MARSAIALVLFMMAGSTGAVAREALVVVARVTIYPGEVLRESMLSDAVLEIAETDDAIRGREEAVGKVARRTLFAGGPVSTSSLDERYTIANGSLVQLLYEKPGISIVASGLALQSAREGDAIRVRNVESGLAVTGVVSKAGKVLVGN